MKTLLLSLLLLTTSAMADTWILRDATTKATLFRSVRSDGYIPEAIGITGAELVRIVQEARPSYNAATQKLVPTAVESGSNPIVRTLSWTVTALSAEELAVLADNADRATAKGRITAADIATLYAWADNADSTTATSGNAVSVLNTLLDRLAPLMRNLADALKAQRLDQN